MQAERLTRMVLGVTLLAAASSGPALELALDGRTAYVVVQAANATAAERFAAQELTNFLHRITGASFPVVAETNPAAVAPSVHV